jgi:hypothetical protein
MKISFIFDTKMLAQAGMRLVMWPTQSLTKKKLIPSSFGGLTSTSSSFKVMPDLSFARIRVRTLVI